MRVRQLCSNGSARSPTARSPPGRGSSWVSALGVANCAAIVRSPSSSRFSSSLTTTIRPERISSIASPAVKRVGRLMGGKRRRRAHSNSKVDRRATAQHCIPTWRPRQTVRVSHSAAVGGVCDSFIDPICRIRNTPLRSSRPVFCLTFRKLVYKLRLSIEAGIRGAATAPKELLGRPAGSLEGCALTGAATTP